MKYSKNWSELYLVNYMGFFWAPIALINRPLSLSSTIYNSAFGVGDVWKGRRRGGLLQLETKRGIQKASSKHSSCQGEEQSEKKRLLDGGVVNPGEHGVGLWEHSASKFCLRGKPSCCGPAHQAWVGTPASFQAICNAMQGKGIKLINLLYRADPTATTANDTTLPERWAYDNKHVGVLAELIKVKEVAPDIMDSSIGKLVLKEEEREWRRKMLEKEEEEREWKRKMLEMISLLARKTLGEEQE